ncbi:MAG: glycosyltransferase [Pseudomonadota bacterium]
MRISVCLMVRNEEAVLARCLASVAALADEIVVVDTGSTDATVEISQRFGAVVHRHPWEEDFSRHRNQSLGYAAGDWILVIDADEELELSVPSAAVKRFLIDLPDGTNAAALRVLDIRQGEVKASFNSPRIFRRGKIHYQGIVHNKPVIEGKKAVVYPEARIRHYGYGLSPEKMAAKFERTERLLQRQLSGTPPDYQAWFYLAELSGMQGRPEKSAEYCERYLEKKEQLGPEWNGSTYYMAARAYMKTGNKDQAWEWITLGLKDYPDDPDLALALSDFGAWVNRPDLMADGAKRAILAHRRILADPARTGARFTFTLKPEVYALCLYRYSLVSLGEGAGALRELKAVWDRLDRGLQNDILEDARTKFDSLGLPGLLAGLDRSVEVSTSNLIPQTAEAYS